MGYDKTKRHAAMRKLFPDMHIEKAKNAMAIWKYCGKEDSRMEGPVEHGLPPASRNVAGDTKERNKMIMEMGVVKACEEGLIPIEKFK